MLKDGRPNDVQAVARVIEETAGMPRHDALRAARLGGGILLEGAPADKVCLLKDALEAAGIGAEARSMKDYRPLGASFHACRVTVTEEGLACTDTTGRKLALKWADAAFVHAHAAADETLRPAPADDLPVIGKKVVPEEFEELLKIITPEKGERISLGMDVGLTDGPTVLIRREGFIPENLPGGPPAHSIDAFMRTLRLVIERAEAALIPDATRVFARTCALDGITFSGIKEIEGYRKWLHQHG
jgi:hypothetical protein